jgi:hypothetical protein
MSYARETTQRASTTNLFIKIKRTAGMEVALPSPYEGSRVSKLWEIKP